MGINNEFYFTSGRFGARLCAVLLAFLTFGAGAYAQTGGSEQGVSYYTVYYPIDGYEITASMYDRNLDTFEELDACLKNHTANHRLDLADSMRVDLSIRASASIDAGKDYNDRLAERRADAMTSYLFANYPQLNGYNIELVITGEDWDELQALVAADPEMPGHRELTALLADQNLTTDEKTQRIKKMSGGATFRHLNTYMMPLLRCITIAVFDPVEAAKYVEPEPTPEPEPEPEPEPQPEPEPVVAEPVEDVVESYAEIDERFWSIRTNLLLLGVCVLNGGVEFPVGDHFSIEIPVTYSPYTVARKWRTRTLTIQPELRWWMGSQMKGHFVGLHAHAGYYNVAWSDEYRYQDKGGKTPMWGFGVSYGYALPIKERWGMDFTLGFGYARFRYDVFYNVNNGATYDTGIKNYWGITRVGVSLIYKFNKHK